MAVVCTREGEKGKIYVPNDAVPGAAPAEDEVRQRLDSLLQQSGLTLPDEPLQSVRPSPNARGVSAVTHVLKEVLVGLAKGAIFS